MEMGMDNNSTNSIPKLNWDELKGSINPENISKYESSISQVNDVLDAFFMNNVYDKLTVAEQIKYDLFASYALCSLHWIYMRNIGKCPVKNGLKQELDKIKEYSNRLQVIEDRKNRPKIQKDAAKRMVKHELWQNDVPNKKIKFSDE
ncbi:nuclear nucleic acid-binding protein C1D-like [Chrysoperla carnea]|uniref:nuclear nucleic acid-binding protein C1D-like n=1 Tax=Chrysoperla carnea TaxID=189513 RepID=UPI001D08CC7D|nr:nuclear nucleic acid-binding protein C1D-like [Chrysoperla carnea]